MRGRTGHENKTVNTYCEHRLRPPPSQSSVSPSFGRPAFSLRWPCLWSIPPWTQIGAGRSCARTAFVWCQLCVPGKLKLHGRAAAAQSRASSAIRLRIWKTWRAAATRRWMQYPVRPFVNRSASIAGAFAGSGYRPIDVMGGIWTRVQMHMDLNRGCIAWDGLSSLSLRIYFCFCTKPGPSRRMQAARIGNTLRLIL